MSRVLKIGGGIVLAIVLIVGGVMWLTNGPAVAATAFFESCVNDGLDSAYDKTSPGFREAVTRAQFAEFSAANRLGSSPAQTAQSTRMAVRFPSAPGMLKVAATSSKDDPGTEHVESVQPLPPNVTFEQIQAYLRRPPVYQLELAQLKRGQASVPGYCPGMKLRSVQLLVAQGPQVDPNGDIVGGVFRESWMGLNCGDAHPRLNVWTVVQANRAPDVFLSYNGTSIADPRLQRDGFPMAMASANHRVPNCARMDVADTHFDTYEGSPMPASGGRKVRPWREAWLMVGCQHAVKVVMHFIPDSTGTSAASHPEESVLLQ